MLAMLKNLLNESDNWLNFASFMHHALYDPKFGYYTGFSQKFGPHGDFITAPEISDLFGKTIARQIAQCLSLTGGSVLEIGGGSGVFNHFIGVGVCAGLNPHANTAAAAAALTVATACHHAAVCDRLVRHSVVWHVGSGHADGCRLDWR